MKAISYSEGQAFWRDLSEPLKQQPVLNNVFIGVAHRIRKDLRKDLCRCGVFSNRQLVLGALCTPPHRLNLAHVGQGPRGVEALVDYLSSAEAAFPGVVGERVVAEAFASRWSTVTGQASMTRKRPGALQELYEITEIRPTAGVSGTLRQARAAERDLILQWETAFATEVCLPAAERESAYIAQLVDQGLAEQALFVWESDGEPVASARLRSIVEIGARVSGVYTPDDRRGHGYASALTAALSQRVLNEGKWCCLFTDAGNPVSNKIYQRIGYVRLASFADVLFGDA